MPAEPSAWCVIGAGPSGLTALKNLRGCGIPAECLEREDGIGGNWRFGSPSSRVFASTRLISSRRLTEFVDHPMPRSWPAYPDHGQCLAYLQDYARRFDLLPHIRFQTAVERIERPEDGGSGWVVTTAVGKATRYAGVVIASGHNREPRWPDIPGTFTGSLLHAADYKSPTQPVALSDKRVLVIGGGNSGCDIAVEVSRHAARTVLSTRRGYHVVPRFILGRPADVRGERLLSMGAPLWLRRIVSLRMIDRAVGLPWRHGLPRPDHRLFETHPVVNDELCSCVRSGAVKPAGDVAAFAGTEVEFMDGSRAAFDAVICATGYRIEHPFIASEHLASHDGLPELFLNLLHPVHDDIAVVGLIQPDSGQWGITDVQAQLVARMALAARSGPRAAAWLYRQRQQPPRRGPIRYVDSPRHRLEVEHYSYRRRLEQLVRGMDRRLVRELERDPEPGAADSRRVPRARGRSRP
jgi:hypothetical protein